MLTNANKIMAIVMSMLVVSILLEVANVFATKDSSAMALIAAISTNAVSTMVAAILSLTAKTLLEAVLAPADLHLYVLNNIMCNIVDGRWH